MEIKSLARAFKQACIKGSHICDLLYWESGFSEILVLLKCFNVFGMIIDNTFGIIVFFAQALFISAPAKRGKARSITALFQLMSMQEHIKKKKHGPQIYNQKQTWLEFPGRVSQPYGQVRERESEKDRELLSQGKTMAGGGLFFPERGNSNKQWLMGAWWAITAHRSQPRGGSRQESFNSYNWIPLLIALGWKILIYYVTVMITHTAGAHNCSDCWQSRIPLQCKHQGSKQSFHHVYMSLKGTYYAFLYFVSRSVTMKYVHIKCCQSLK